MKYKYVDFYSKGKKSGSVVLKDGKFSFDGLPDEAVRILKEEGMAVGTPMKVMFMKDSDPEEFLSKMHMEYNGSYLFATEMMEGDDG